MSTAELTRLEVMHRLETKRLTQKEAAGMLGLSIRQIKRIWRGYRLHGAAGLISKKRGKPSNNRLKPRTRQQALDLLYKHYPDFGPTLAHEKLTERHHLKLSVETVRKLMIAEGLWKPKRAKKAVVHQMRARRACFGELVQVDGSPHDWFEGRSPDCTLLVFIDDATGRLLELLFAPGETTFSYWSAMRRYLCRYGKPRALYSSGTSGATLWAKLSVLQKGKREPEAFTMSRAWLMSKVRQRMIASRDHSTARSAWVWDDRRWMGESNSGSRRANRARVSASARLPLRGSW